MLPAVEYVASSLPRSFYRSDYMASKAWQFTLSLSKSRTLQLWCIFQLIPTL